MKLENNSIGTLSQGFESKDVSVVGVNADALEIVSQMFQNDIYSNKLEAAIRETIANAIDEHVKYNVDLFVDVRLETQKNETWLSVRDFAKGLDEKNLREVFGGLFCSTKNLTNSATGGFGIGAKSPICYAESFIVTSFFEGKKTSFVFYRDRGVTGSSITKIAKFNEEESGEPSGIEVRIPIQINDISKANRIVSNFVQDLDQDTKIVYTNNYKETIIPAKEKVWSIGNFKIVQKQHQFDDLVCIRMGSIVYPLPKFFNFNDQIINTARTLIDVPIGTFSMPPSRETLSDVPENIKKWNLISSQIQDFYNKTKTLVKLSYEDLIQEYVEAECFQFRIFDEFNLPRSFFKGELNKTKKLFAVFEKGKASHWTHKKIEYFTKNNPDYSFVYAYAGWDKFKEILDKVRAIDNSIECVTEKNNCFRIPKQKGNLKQEFVFQTKERDYSRPITDKLSIEQYIKSYPIPDNFDLQKVDSIDKLKKVCVAELVKGGIRLTNVNHCCQSAVKILVENGYFDWSDSKVQAVYQKLRNSQQEIEKKQQLVSKYTSNNLISQRSRQILYKYNTKDQNKAILYASKLEKGFQKISEKSPLHQKLVDRCSSLCYNGFNRKEIKHIIKNIA